MIYNERQYKITTRQIKEFTEALERMDYQDGDWLQQAQYSAIKSQLDDLKAQALEYQLLKEGNIKHTESSELSHLPITLIQARISRGLTQQDLADHLNLHPQQIQRYEASNYMGASLSRLIEIANVLGISVTESWDATSQPSGDAFYSWGDSSNISWDKFPIKEMLKRGWIKVMHGSNPTEVLKSYFETSAGAQYATALHRKKFHGSNTPNEFSLLAWQARVLELANHSLNESKIPDFDLNDSWIDDLVSLTLQDNSPLLAQEFLASKGIILVIEPHLSKTYLDGAAMLSPSGHPVIALTLRHDRLDNFWFVLMHELGHIFLHLFESLNMDFFDEEGSPENDQLEQEADQFALDTLIPQHKWDQCLSRFSISNETVLLDAQTLGVHPSIVAGRIRKERGYTILSDLVGQGEVRKLFGLHG